MHYVIQYYRERVCGQLPDFEAVDVPLQDLIKVKAQAARSVEPGAPFAWAQAYEIMDYDLSDDPAVASWRRA